MGSLWDCIHSFLLSRPPGSLCQELHNFAFRKTLGVPQQLVIVFVNWKYRFKWNEGQDINIFKPPRFIWIQEGWERLWCKYTKTQLTFLIVFVFAQTHRSFCLIHGTHHNLLLGKTSFTLSVAPRLFQSVLRAQKKIWISFMANICIYFIKCLHIHIKFINSHSLNRCFFYS